MRIAWRPELFERAEESATVELHRFHVEDWSGVKHTDLPRGFESEPADRE